MSLIWPDSPWALPSEFPDLSSGIKAVDVETRDIGLANQLGPGWAFNLNGSRCGGDLLGVSVAHESGFCGYFPFGHEEGEQFEERRVLMWLRQVMSGGVVVMHNASYDLGWLGAYGVRPGADTVIFDTYIGAALVLWQNRYHNLDAVARHYKVPGKDKALLREAAAVIGVQESKVMTKLAQIPPQFVGPYAEADALATLKIYDKLREDIERDKCGQVFELETQVMIAMQEVRARGVKVNEDAIEVCMGNMKRQIAELRAVIKRQTGDDPDPWRAEQLARAFGKIGIQCPRTSLGLPSITKEFLTGHASAGVATANAVLDLRTLDKGLQFADAIKRHVVNGRIHAEFNSLWSESGGAKTGRFSSSSPNLQNIPARSEMIAKQIRDLFVPEAGYQWDCFDFASQEPRWTVHWAFVKGFQRAKEAREEYLRNNNHDFHAWASTLFGVPRKQAKALFLGTVYCKGGASTCDELNLPTIWVKPPQWETPVDSATDGAVRVAGEEGRRIRYAFNDELPFVRELQKRAEEVAGANGFIRTVSGRRVPVKRATFDPDANKKRRDGEEHKAVNYLIQGSAADQMKRAVVACVRAGYVPRILVHDESDFVDLEDDKARREVAEIMEHACDDWLSVPSKIDVESGPAWGSLT